MERDLSSAEVLSFYEGQLRDRILPFWVPRCVDTEYGGLFNILDDAGQILSTDKFSWSQGRALWTFSALYNRLDHDPRWIEIARPLACFLLRHGRDQQGRWVYRLRRDGAVLEGHRSVYADAFAMYGLTEYARATGDAAALEAALAVYERTSPLLDEHASLATEPHPIPRGVRSHGPSMMFSHCYHELGLVAERTDILRRSLDLADVVMHLHVSDTERILYEFVKPEGGMADGDVGRTFIPGHAIETTWFLERVYRYHGRHEMLPLLLDLLRSHLEKGWDQEYGGLYLARHTGGGRPAWHEPEAKVWWPHVEALYALLRAWRSSALPWCREWYWRVRDYAFRVFPDAEHGEWRQNLDRRGSPIAVVVKGLPVKDPFHLPRALLLSIECARQTR